MGSLDKYRRKRDFTRTREPSGQQAALEMASKGAVSGGRFVIHKHAARNLHYDLRLEYNGVLKSWAVPKGPSLDPGEKRLAVEVEDHPLEYADFEGVIPKDQYGGGTSMLWDSGQWKLAQRAGNKVHPEERLDFELNGQKLRGAWTLVRTGRRGKKSNQWLLIKRRDRGVEASQINDFSVATGRTMEQIAARENAGEDTNRQALLVGNEKGRKKALPKAPKPTLATLAKKAPAGDNWLHEIKFDGYRVLARYDQGNVELLTRNGNDWSGRFPEIAKQVTNLACDQAILDGEVVASQADGTTSFRALQEALAAKKTSRLAYQAFDLLYLNGRDLTTLALTERKQVLKPLLTTSGFHKGASIRYTDHMLGKGPEFAKHACSLGLEGVISKKADGKYQSGRSRDWLKIKCTAHEEFIICGYTEPSGSRLGFGSLLLGAWHEGALVYVGRVGTGFSEQLLKKIYDHLTAIERKTSPFTQTPPNTHEVHWVEPALVAEVEFSNWTRDGLLRHSSFRGLREDKKAQEVALPANVAPRQTPTPKPRKLAKGTAEVAGVRLTHADRVLFPEQGITKLALAEYYEAIYSWILPNLQNRPLALVRCPDGYTGDCFFQKHPGQTLGKSLERVMIQEKNKKSAYVYIQSLADLIALVQVGTLELHAWGSRIEEPERPDTLVFDLDPAEGIPLSEVVRVARSLRERLTGLGLISFPRTTGGKGFHLVVPIAPEHNWDKVKTFCKRVAQAEAKADPQRVTSVMSKQRRQGRIFLDYLRNGRGATAIASYSPRARKNAPVAVPVTWDEVTPTLRPDRYNVDNLRRRLSALKQDPWANYESSRRPLSDEVLQAVGMNKGGENG